MSTEKQKQASRANGARSRGPVTEQGKRFAARNSVRHGLLSSSVVLDVELSDRFDDILNDLIDEFQPWTATQVTLIEIMAAARWRQLRVWCAQKIALDREIALQDPNLEPVAQILLALRGSSDTACSPELLLRYELAFDHQFHRALKRLVALQATPAPGGVAPCAAKPADPGETPTTKRTQEVVEKEDPPLPNRDPQGADRCETVSNRTSIVTVLKALLRRIRNPPLTPSAFAGNLSNGILVRGLS